MATLIRISLRIRPQNEISVHSADWRRQESILAIDSDEGQSVYFGRGNERNSPTVRGFSGSGSFIRFFQGASIFRCATLISELILRKEVDIAPEDCFAFLRDSGNAQLGTIFPNSFFVSVPIFLNGAVMGLPEFLLARFDWPSGRGKLVVSDFFSPGSKLFSDHFDSPNADT